MLADALGERLSRFSARPADIDDRAETRLAPCIALIGCDGSGKSTLSHDLERLLGRKARTRLVYLGLGTGDLARRIGNWPILGVALERYLTGKASKAHNTDKRLPGLATALVMLGLSLIRYRRFRSALADRRNGIQVISDRYPQAEVPGSFDGPGLSWLRQGSPLAKRIAAVERSLYHEMASHRPTLIFRLDVDADTALARKPDHTRQLLEKKLAVLPTLGFDGAAIVEIDAKRPYPEVREDILAVLRENGLFR